MRFNVIAAAVAAAMLSFSAVAQDKKPEQSAQGSSASSQSTPGSSAPAASTEKSNGGASASGGASSPAKKAEGSAAAGGSKGGQRMSHNAETIKQVQTKLKEQGHDVGEADGKMGPKTMAGLKAFQQSKNMKATGQLDQQTMAALGVDSASGGASASKKSEGSARTATSSP
ncbi:MAG: peptidoglycan-binding domain-containing protein [Alphaproteobacteria bacterium]